MIFRGWPLGRQLGNPVGVCQHAPSSDQVQPLVVVDIWFVEILAERLVQIQLPASARLRTA